LITALEIALGNNSEPEILDALRLAETRDMENVANGTAPFTPNNKPIFGIKRGQRC
jgi:hypothetical protein